MIKSFIRQILESALNLNKKITHFFTSGSFAIAVYPFLMHPCVQTSYKLFIRLAAVVLAFSGVFYLLAELVTSLFSSASLASYFRHTTLELLIPFGSEIDGRKSELSPLYYVMTSVFASQSYLFIFAYCFGITYIAEKKFHILGMFFAILFGLGLMLISSSQGGKYTDGGLQSLGATITYLLGNFTLIITGLTISKTHLASFRKYSLRAGFIGFVAVLVTLFYPSAFTPFLERVGIYSIVIWQVLAAFAITKRIK